MADRRGWTLCVALVMLLAYAEPAPGVQASGPLIVVPDPLPPGAGDAIEVSVGIESTSSGTPPSSLPDPFGPVEAFLAGSVLVRTPCLSGSCEFPLTVFVPVGPNGCVQSDPAVAACFQSAPGEVAIALSDAGLVLPPASSVQLATVRLRVQDPATIGFRDRLDIEAATEPRALRACASGEPVNICALGASFGASVIGFVAPAVRCVRCRGTIRFRGDPPLTKLEVAGKIELASSFEADNGVRVTLSREEGGAELLNLLLPGGSLRPQGTSALVYKDPRAAAAGGIALLQVRRRANDEMTFRLVAYDLQLDPELTEPGMDVSLVFGALFTGADGPWIRRRWGWQLEPGD
ncbi:MAG: hypothetical protein AB1689_04825 [Thermodesulfobacteriota bacterium]